MPETGRPVLVTGAAGFIGYHVARRLLAQGRRVVGVDCFSDYYDPALKEARFRSLSGYPAFSGHRQDMSRSGIATRLFDEHGFQEVVHLAAQPGVRHALTHAEDYIGANLSAFVHLLEACRHGDVRHLVYASSSSVYGRNRKLPFAESDPVDHPISLYAATKRANELMAHSYSHLFGLPTTGLRLFTVYGPWGRPDMAVYKFTDAIAQGITIAVADSGEISRDFTYVDDVTDGIVRLLAAPPKGPPPKGAPPKGPPSDALAHPARSDAPFRLVNLGGDRPATLNDVIGLIERALGRSAVRTAMALPPGDVRETRSDPAWLEREVGCLPATPLSVGIPRFVAWYLDYQQGLVAQGLPRREP